MSDSIPVYLIGLLAQALFSARVIVQWALSEKKREVVSPTLFWVLSLVASVIFFAYGWLRNDFALMLGQIIGYYVYMWNLGAKGVWKLIGGLRHAVVPLLSIIPPLFITLLVAKDPAAIIAELFSNEAIPTALIVFGSLGQAVFSCRFIYQLIYSIKRGESVLPKGFWLISLVGAIMIFTYGLIRLDPVVLLAQSFGIASYIRNLMIWKKSHRPSAS